MPVPFLSTLEETCAEDATESLISHGEGCVLVEKLLVVGTRCHYPSLCFGQMPSCGGRRTDLHALESAADPPSANNEPAPSSPLPTHPPSSVRPSAGSFSLSEKVHIYSDRVGTGSGESRGTQSCNEANGAHCCEALARKATATRARDGARQQRHVPVMARGNSDTCPSICAMPNRPAAAGRSRASASSWTTPTAAAAVAAAAAAVVVAAGAAAALSLCAAGGRAPCQPGAGLIRIPPPPPAMPQAQLIQLVGWMDALHS
jgi:hypothetical protein